MASIKDIHGRPVQAYARKGPRCASPGCKYRTSGDHYCDQCESIGRDVADDEADARERDLAGREATYERLRPL